MKQRAFGSAIVAAGGIDVVSAAMARFSYTCDSDCDCSDCSDCDCSDCDCSDDNQDLQHTCQMALDLAICGAPCGTDGAGTCDVDSGACVCDLLYSGEACDEYWWPALHRSWDDGKIWYIPIVSALILFICVGLRRQQRQKESVRSLNARLVESDCHTIHHAPLGGAALPLFDPHSVVAVVPEGQSMEHQQIQQRVQGLPMAQPVAPYAQNAPSHPPSTSFHTNNDKPGAVGTMYKVKSNAKVRAGFAPTSQDLGERVVAVGEKITALETRVNDKGIVRVRFDRGWISETAGDGTVLLTAMSRDDDEDSSGSEYETRSEEGESECAPGVAAVHV